MFSIKLRLKAKPQNVALVNHKPVDSLPIQPERLVHSDPARITRMAVDESVKAVPANAKEEPKLEQPVPEPSESNQVQSEPTTSPTVVPKKAGKNSIKWIPKGSPIFIRKHSFKSPSLKRLCQVQVHPENQVHLLSSRNPNLHQNLLSRLTPTRASTSNPMKSPFLPSISLIKSMWSV